MLIVGMSLMKYSKFTEKIYKTVRKANSYDEYGKIIDRVNHDQRFESSKFAYVQDRTDFPVVTFDIFIGYKDGWITTDDIILVDSDTIPDSILTMSKYFFEKKWVPSWYNKIIHSNKMLDDYSERYKNNKTFEEYYFAQIHNIEFRNTVLVFLDTDGESYFSIKNIRKKIMYITYTVNWQKMHKHFLMILIKNLLIIFPTLGYGKMHYL